MISALNSKSHKLFLGFRCCCCFCFCFFFCCCCCCFFLLTLTLTFLLLLLVFIFSVRQHCTVKLPGSLGIVVVTETYESAIKRKSNALPYCMRVYNFVGPKKNSELVKARTTKKIKKHNKIKMLVGTRQLENRVSRM